MQVLAHTGPNWNPGALDVSPDLQLVAIGSRGTVLLYDYNGNFVSELRAAGRGRVTAVRFCRAPALTHLLAVGTSDGFVRIFDAPARRIFRRVQEPSIGERARPVFALRFAERYPNVLIIVFSPNRLVCWRFEKAEKLSCVVDRELDFRQVLCVESVPGFSSLLVISGTLRHDAQLGLVSVVDLAGKNARIVLHTGGVVHDVAAKVCETNDGTSLVFLAMCSSACLKPFLSSSSDGIHWTTNPKASEDLNGEGESEKQVNKARSTQKSMKSGSLRCSVTWCGEHFLVTSDHRGALRLYRLMSGGLLTESTSRQGAHRRQVFSLVSLHGSRGFVSISMDRTLAFWSLSEAGLGNVTMRLARRTLRTNGPVRTLAVSRSVRNGFVEPSLRLKNETNQNVVLSFSGDDGLVTCIALDLLSGVCSMVGEASPFGNNTGKRKRENVIALTPFPVEVDGLEVGAGSMQCVAAFGGSQGRMGFLSYRDGQLEFICSKRPKTSAKTSIHTVRCNSGLAVSVVVNGELSQWTVPQSLTAWEDSKKNSLRAEAVTSIGCNGACPPVATVYCAAGLADDTSHLYLFGYSEGLLALYSASGKCCLRLQATGLATITSLAFEDASGVLAAGDSQGSLSLFSIDLSNVDTSRNFSSPDNDAQILNPEAFSNIGENIVTLLWAPVALKHESEKERDSTYIAVLSTKGEISVWAFHKTNGLQLRAEIRGHAGKVSSLGWVTESSLSTAGEDGTVRTWDVERQPRPRRGAVTS